jgi:adenine/guanine phosphoribosyltransferase-like PRPP-binding protein
MDQDLERAALVALLRRGDRPWLAAKLLGAGTADVVVPVSLALKGEQYANELWRYKNAVGPQQQYFRTGLAAVLWRFLAMHEECVRTHCAVPSFDIVTTVPSTSGRAGHPLRAMVAEMTGATRDRYRDLLVATPEAADLGRAASFRRYASAALRGENVLLIDDTWATGNHAQSAAAALKAAGAGTVAIVVLGRHLNIDYGDTAEHVAQARLRRFSWDTCPLRPWRHS